MLETLSTSATLLSLQKEERKQKFSRRDYHQSLTRFISTTLGKDSLTYEGVGTIRVSDDEGHYASISDVLYSPKSTANLLSMRCLMLEGFNIDFKRDTFVVSIDEWNKKGLYNCNTPVLRFINPKQNLVSFLSQDETLHKALGHVSYSRIRQKLGIKVKKQSVCKACAISKISQTPFNKKHSWAERPF